MSNHCEQVNPSSPVLVQGSSSDVVKLTDRLGEVGDLTVPENEQELTSYWEVEEDQTQVMDVQGYLR